jgi:electron transfer flavoprotein alpha subunit
MKTLNQTDYKGVLILTENEDGKLTPISKEVLAAGHNLADSLHESLSAVVVNGTAHIAFEALLFGADRVYLANDPLLQDYRTDAWLAVLEKVVRQIKPRIILLGQTIIGRDLAPRAAFRLNSAVIMDCVALNIDIGTKQLKLTKPVYGGNALAVYSIATLPQMATIRARAFSPVIPDNAPKGEIIRLAVELKASDIRTTVLRKVVQETPGPKLEDAKVIVAGGRGIDGPEGFKKLESLAKTLNGSMGASRPPCDSGWVPDTLQIGLTGKVVTPDVYIAVGISGSSQHLAGCSGAKNIIAINKDNEANIFRQSRFGVVGDWKQVLPGFEEKVKDLKGGK